MSETMSAAPSRSPPIAAVQAPASAPPTGSQAIKEAVEQLRSAMPSLQEASPRLANSVSTLLQRADDPVRLNQAEFQHRVAYAFRDVEGTVGQMKLSDPSIRAHIEALSVSAPGLRSAQVTDLLNATIANGDLGIRNDVRRMAIEIGKQTDQDTPQIRSQLDVLGNRVRLSPVTEKAPSPAEAPASKAEAAPPLAPAVDAAGRTAASNQAGAPGERNPRTSGRTDPAFGGRPDEHAGRDLAAAGAGTMFASAMLRGFAKLGEAVPPPPWENMTTNFGDRLRAFEERRQGQADRKITDGLEQSGRAAITALQSFSNNEGAVMMNRLGQAARSDPNGMEGVMAEMKPGGKYAALRQQFNTAITHEKGFAAAYEKALEAVGQYAQERSGAAPVLARSPDAVAVTARLESIERNIGERMTGVPSKSDGKSMMHDLRDQAAELFKGVAEGLKNLFQRATAGASPSPGS